MLGSRDDVAYDASAGFPSDSRGRGYNISFFFFQLMKRFSTNVLREHTYLGMTDPLVVRRARHRLQLMRDALAGEDYRRNEEDEDREQPKEFLDLSAVSRHG